MINILVLWVTFLVGFCVGLFWAGLQNEKLRRRIEEKCSLCFQDPNFGRTVKAAFDLSEPHK